MGVVGKAPQAQAGALHAGLLQNPEGQHGPVLVRGLFKLNQLRIGQNPLGKAQIDPPVQLLGVQAHTVPAQHAEGVTVGMADGKMVGAVREIGAAPGGNMNGRQRLTGFFPVERFQQGPSGLMAGLPGQTAGGESHWESMMLPPSERGIPFFSRSQAIKTPSRATSRPKSTITIREVVMGSRINTAPRMALIRA